MIATWRLACQPVLFGAGVTGEAMLLPDRGRWLSSLPPGQGVATVGLLLYALLVSPLVPHDGLGTFLSGVMIVRYPRAGPVKEGSGSASFGLASPGLGITGSTMCDGRASS